MGLPSFHRFYFMDQIAANDMFQGLDKAAMVFDDYTKDQFNNVKTLHSILLVASLGLIAAFIVLTYRPYVAKVRAESKVVAGLLSQLPAEVDVLAQIKAVMLGLRKEELQTAVAAAQGPVILGTVMPPGAVYPGGMMMGQGPPLDWASIPLQSPGRLLE
jgi:hypothetical protein